MKRVLINGDKTPVAGQSRRGALAKREIGRGGRGGGGEEEGGVLICTGKPGPLFKTALNDLQPKSIPA